MYDLDPINNPDLQDPPEPLECEECGATVRVQDRPHLYPLCETCDERHLEQLAEQKYEAHHGASTPQTVQERYARDVAEARRRR